MRLIIELVMAIKSNNDENAISSEESNVFDKTWIVLFNTPISYCTALVVVGTVGFALIIISIAAAVTSGPRSPCDDISPDGDEVDGLQSQICDQLACSFDTGQCDLNCPFGYASNSDDCPNACMCAAESNNFQGDIEFQEDEVPSLLQSFGYTSDVSDAFSVLASRTSAVNVRKWDTYFSDGRYKVPYVIDGKYGNNYRNLIMQGQSWIVEKTCIDLIPRSTEQIFIKYVPSRSCKSGLGRRIRPPGEGHPISLNERRCRPAGTPAHETIHALGFHHEHSRPDRDQYVRILMVNIVKAASPNFKILSNSDTARGVTTDYDPDSVMHYGGRYFSKNGKSTILRIDNGEEVVAQRTRVTNLDAEGINRFYKCPLAPSTTTTLAPSSTTTLRTTTSATTTTTAVTTTTTTTTTTATTTTTPVTTTTTLTATTPTTFTTALTTTRTLTPTFSTTPTPPSSPSVNSLLTPISHQTSPTVTPLQKPISKPRKKLKASRATTHWGPWGPFRGCIESVENCWFGGIALRRRPCVLGTIQECSALFPRGIRYFQVRECLFLPCHQDWEQWGPWQKCSRSCGGGSTLRYREPQDSDCALESSEARNCNSELCVGLPSWSSWTLKFECSKTCGGNGIEVEERFCVLPNGDRFVGKGPCQGRNLRTNMCPKSACPQSDELNDFSYRTIFSESPTNSRLDLFNVVSQSECLLGDVNGDGTSDVLCDNNGEFMVGYSSTDGKINEVNWKGDIVKCTGGVRLSADFDGDGLDDVLCLDTTSKWLTVTFSVNGTFPFQPYESKVCTNAGDEIFLLDGNGDKLTDILCSHSDSSAYELIFPFPVGG